MLSTIAAAADPPAMSPSFDCRKASTEAEIATCKTPALASADAAMAEAYHSALKRLSQDGQQQLRRDQRSYIGRIEVGCHPGEPFFQSSEEHYADYAGCLTSSFTVRTRQLVRSVQFLSGRTFLILTQGRERRTSPSKDRDLVPVRKEDLTLVQIDAPRSVAERHWNNAMRQWLKFGQSLASPEDGEGWFGSGDEPGVNAVEISVSAVSSQVISASLDASACWGGAHCSDERRVILWSITLDRKLGPADLFSDLHNRALRRLVTNSYKAGGDHEGCDEPDLSSTLPSLSREGLSFSFNPYELGAYTCGGGAGIRWSAVAPYLSRSLPFRPEMLVDAAR